MVTGEKAKEKILKGMTTVSDVVSKTMGKNGKSVILRDELTGGFRVTKDGVSVVNSIFCEDKYEECGAGYIKNVANNVVRDAGDGTSTSTLLTKTMCEKSIKPTYYTHVEVIRQLKYDLEKFNEYLDDVTIPVKLNKNMITQIASISSNDKEIGEVVADAYEMAEYQMVDVKKTDNLKTTVERLKGYNMMNTGYQHTGFINNFEKGTADVINPVIYIHNGIIREISSQFSEILSKNIDNTSPEHRPLVIVYQDIEDHVLEQIINAISKGALHDVFLVKTNLIHTSRKDWLVDLSKVTNAEYTETEFVNPGTCDKVVIGKDETLFINGAGDYENYLDKLKEQNTENIDFKNRIKALDVKASVIKVGGTLSSEIGEKYDRIEDAVLAVRSAISDGVVPGGGSTFLHALSKCSFRSNIIKETMSVVQDQILKNTGLVSEIYREKVLDSDFGYGYNLNTNKVENLIEAGIFDPTRVLRVSFENAVKTVINFITIEAII